MRDISLSLQHPAMWPVALLILSVLIVVWWTYRRTYPPLSGVYRLMLAGIRTLAVLLTGMLVFEPLVVFSGEQTRLERVAVLIDNSASMLLPLSAEIGDTTSRLVAARAMLEDIVEVRDTTVKKFGFGRSLKEVGSLGALSAFDVEDRTDLAGALEQLLSEPGPGWDRLVLIGDGRVNAGSDPLTVLPDSGLIVDAVLTGEQPPSGAISLAGIEQTAPAYEDAQVELELTLARAAGTGGQVGERGPAMVDVFLDGRKVTQRRVEFPGAGAGLTSSRLSFPSPEAGSYWLEASLRSTPGEWSNLDNRRLMRIHVRKSKRIFLLVSNSPDWDITFTGRALAANEDWSVRTVLVLDGQGGAKFIRNSNGTGGFSPGRLPSRSDLEEASLLLLHGEINRFSRDFLDRVAARSSAGEFGLVLWAAGRFDPRALPPELASLLPLAAGAGALAPVDAPQTPSRLFTTGRYGVLNALGGGGVIDGLPPLTTVYRGLRLSRQSEVLARAGSRGALAGEGQPVLAVVPTGGVRSALVAAQGFWRWHMQRQTGSPGEAAHYNRLWTELADWLTSAGKMTPLTLEPEREVFGRGQPLRMRGSVKLEDGAGEVSVNCALWRKDSSGVVDTLAILSAAAAGSGESFALDFGTYPPGRYFYGATAAVSGETLSAGGALAVEEYSPEFGEPSPDSTVFAALASRTGGRLIRSRQEAKALEQTSSISEPVSSSSGLAREGWIYWLIVALLASEWALRRRKALS